MKNLARTADSKEHWLRGRGIERMNKKYTIIEIDDAVSNLKYLARQNPSYAESVDLALDAIERMAGT